MAIREHDNGFQVKHDSAKALAEIHISPLRVEATIPRYLTGGDKTFKLAPGEPHRVLNLWAGRNKRLEPLEAVLRVDGREVSRGWARFNGDETTETTAFEIAPNTDPRPAMRAGRQAELRLFFQWESETALVLDLMIDDLTGFKTADKIGRNLARTANEKYEAGQCDDRCYLTTACCEHFGRPDTCWELRTLRWYRDRVLALQADGPAALQAYYRKAPGIVAALPERGLRRDAALARIYWLTVLPCALLIQCRAFGLARRRYEQTFRRLCARWLTA